MITSLDVYLVMQMDAILAVFKVTSIISLILLAILSLFLLIPCLDGLGPDDVPSFIKIAIKRVAIVLVASTIGSALFPSSKTVAAMLILPALSSPEVLHPIGEEFRELYDLAKDALRGVAEKQEERTD